MEVLVPPPREGKHMFRFGGLSNLAGAIWEGLNRGHSIFPAYRTGKKNIAFLGAGAALCCLLKGIPKRGPTFD